MSVFLGFDAESRQPILPLHTIVGATARECGRSSGTSAEVFGLTGPDATRLIDEVQQIVRSHWRAALAARDVSETDVQRIEGCFDPPSFEAPPPKQTFA